MAGRGKAASKTVSGKRRTANSKAAAEAGGSQGGALGGVSPMEQLLEEDGDAALTPDEMDVEAAGEDNVVEIVEEAVGPIRNQVWGSVRDVGADNYFHRTTDGVFRLPSNEYESFKVPEDLVDRPAEPLFLLKYKASLNEYKPVLQGQETLTHIIHFNDYLPSPVPGSEGCFLELKIIPEQLTFIPNTPFTRFFGLAEGIRSKTMIPHNAQGSCTFPDEMINAFDHVQYCLSIRFAITFDLADRTKPLLELRVVRRNQTDATSLTTSLDVTSMRGGFIPLNVLRPQNICQADGLPFPVYMCLFNKPCTMATYRKFQIQVLPGFLKLIFSHKNHSQSSYNEAVRRGKSGNKRYFDTLVRDNHRPPMEQLANDAVPRDPATPATNTSQREGDLLTASHQIRTQNTYGSARHAANSLPLLMDILDQQTIDRPTTARPAPSPALPPQRRAQPTSDILEQESEDEDEALRNPPPKLPQPPKRKAPPSRTTAPTHADPDTSHLSGIELYKALLVGNKINGSSTVMACQSLNLQPEDLAIIFPNIGLSTLSQVSSLILSLRGLEEMNRSQEAKKVNSSSSINIDTLIANKALVMQPRTFPEVIDDLTAEHTSDRCFQRLPIVKMQDLFIMDAKRHVDTRPIIGYDMSDIGGVSHVRERGWVAAHNPGAQAITIKDFIPRCMANNLQKKIKLEGEFSLVESSGMRDANSVKEFQKTIVLFSRVMQQTHPSILCYHTLHFFLIEEDWFLNEDKKGYSQIIFLTNFVDYYLQGLSDCYRNLTPPPTKHELYTWLRAFKDSIAGTAPPTTSSGGAAGSGAGRRNNRSGQWNGQAASGSKPDTPAHHQPYMTCNYFNNNPKGCSRTSTATPNYCVYRDQRYEHKCDVKGKNGKLCLKLHAGSAHT